MFSGLHVNIHYYCLILMKLEFCRQILEKYSNTIFHENPSIENRVVPCGLTDGLTDMTKLIIATHNSAKELRAVFHTSIKGK